MVMRRVGVRYDVLELLLKKEIPTSVLTIHALIEAEFVFRDKTFPTAEEAMLWLQTELGEACEVLLARKTWVRNNPEKHSKYTSNDFESELGDIIYMAIIAGMAEGLDPLEAMNEKVTNAVKKEIDGRSDDNSALREV